MDRIVLDQTSVSALGRIGGFTELCDPAGRVVGYFTPAHSASLYDGVECPVSDEELRRRAGSGQGRTLPEIMADLEKRA